MAWAGTIDRCHGKTIEGWVSSKEDPQRRVDCEFWIDDLLIGTCVADRFRKDLLEAGFDDGCCSYVFTPPAYVRPESLARVSVKVAGATCYLRPGLPPVTDPPNVVERESKTGSFDGSSFTPTGVLLSGWACDRAASSRVVEFIVVSGGEVVSTLPVNGERPGDDHAYTFDGVVSFKEWNLLVVNFSVLAVFSTGEIVKLPRLKGPYVPDVEIRNALDFERLVQSPATRMPDMFHNVMLAYYALYKFPRDFAVCGGALCVIGYRLLEGAPPLPPVMTEVFNGHADRVRNWKEGRQGLALRWLNSICLVEAYLAYQRNDDEVALQRFAEMISRHRDLQFWPSAATNILIAIFVSGFIKFTTNDLDSAERFWSMAEDVMRRGVMFALLNNAFAYSELVNAVNVARQCYIGLTMIAEWRRRGILGSEDTGQLALGDISGPFGKLVHLRNLRRRGPAKLRPDGR